MFTLEVIQKKIESDQANFPPVFRDKPGIITGFAHDLLMTCPTKGTGNDIKRVSCDRVNPCL